MNKAEADFCHTSLDTLARHYPNESKTGERILERLVQEADAKDSKVSLRASSYTRTIRAWAKTSTKADDSSNDPSPYLRAKAILDRMKERHASNPTIHPAPDIHTYNALLYACTMAKSIAATALAQEIVESLEKAAASEGSPKPSPGMYNNLIHAHAQIADRHYGAATAAEDWLMHCSKLHADGVLEQGPDTRSFNLIISAWSASPEDKSPDRALAILELMLELEKLSHEQVGPDEQSFGRVIHAFGKRQRPEEADSVFFLALETFHKRYERQQKSDASKNVPSVDLTGCLNTAMLAWSQSQRPDACKRAEAILADVYSYCRKPSFPGFRLELNADSHRLLLNMYLERPAEGIEKADEHLRRMITYFKKGLGPPPDTDCFHTVLSGWLSCANHPEAAARAESLLKDMHLLHVNLEAPCPPEASTFSRCIDLWCKQRHNADAVERVMDLLRSAEKRQLVNIHIYTRTIKFLAPRNAKLAAQVLGQLEAQRQRGAIKERPTGLYAGVIAALAKVRTVETSELALDTLWRMTDSGLNPTAGAFTSVLFAFRGLRSPKATSVVTSILDEMKQRDADPKLELKLDVFTFAVALETLAGVGNMAAAEKACDVLKDMWQLRAQGRKEIEPDTRCLDACLRALYRSGNAKCTSRGVKLLKRFVRNNSSGSSKHVPSARSVQGLLQACSRQGLQYEHKTVSKLMRKLLANETA